MIESQWESRTIFLVCFVVFCISAICSILFELKNDLINAYELSCELKKIEIEIEIEMQMGTETERGKVLSSLQ